MENLLIKFFIGSSGAKCFFRQLFHCLATLSIILLFCCQARAAGAPCFPLDFATFRLGSAPAVTLVVGGIQGDEPGGFSAATLLATRYEIEEGALWVVPNLNFPSIIRRTRGLHGDMNRKFSLLDEKDPEFATVRRIQDLIKHADVRLVLNLHDGSGYYNHEYVDKLHNPARWGQSIIIDQENMENGVFMGALATEADAVAGIVNASLAQPGHAVHVRNTNTAAGDREMEKSLSWFAVRNGKAAFGIEASKELPVALRAYYHLMMVESFLKMSGLRFKRNFDLSPAGVDTAMRENIGVSFAGNRIFLPLEDARSSINYFPLPKNCVSRAITSKPIMAILPCENNDRQLCIHHGNRTIALINPEWRDMEEGLDAMRMIVDGHERLAPFGQILDVDKVAMVKAQPGYRVNAIGFERGVADESEIPLMLKDFQPRFSVDRAGRLFRVEVYKGKKLAGMFLLRFNKKSNVASLPANKRNASSNKF